MPDSAVQPVNPAINTEARHWSGLFASWRSVRQVVRFSVDLVFPPRCAGCGRVDAEWCAACQRALNDTPFPPKVSPLPPLAGVASTAEHSGIIREAVQALKYNGARGMGTVLGARLARHLAAQNWNCEIIVPVPLHTIRLQERGYNQSQELSNTVAVITGLRCIPEALIRNRMTESQVMMSAAERLSNVRNAFSAQSALVSNQNVLLVDDVYTTGATLRACGDALLAAGATAVYGLTVTVARI